jgi:hypothetical protein
MVESQLHSFTFIVNAVFESESIDSRIHHLIYVTLVISSKGDWTNAKFFSSFGIMTTNHSPEPLLVIMNQKIFPRAKSPVLLEAFRKIQMLLLLGVAEQRNSTLLGIYFIALL